MPRRSHAIALIMIVILLVGVIGGASLQWRAGFYTADVRELRIRQLDQHCRDIRQELETIRAHVLDVSVAQQASGEAMFDRLTQSGWRDVNLCTREMMPIQGSCSRGDVHCIAFNVSRALALVR